MGVEHIAIGSDYDGFTDPPDDLKDASELPFLTQRMLAENIEINDIKKILGGNALRLLRENWGK
jgi:membrane dipeptidase